MTTHGVGIEGNSQPGLSSLLTVEGGTHLLDVGVATPPGKVDEVVEPRTAAWGMLKK